MAYMPSATYLASYTHEGRIFVVKCTPSTSGRCTSSYWQLKAFGGIMGKKSRQQHAVFLNFKVELKVGNKVK